MPFLAHKSPDDLTAVLRCFVGKAGVALMRPSGQVGGPRAAVGALPQVPPR